MFDVDNRVGLMVDNVPNKRKSIEPCEMIFNRIYVNSSGFLTACCSDYNGMLTVADLNEIDLKDAWKCKMLQELRRQHLQREMEIINALIVCIILIKKILCL